MGNREQQLEEEMRAAESLLPQFGEGAVAEHVEDDPPDIVIRCANGLIVGLEVVRWVDESDIAAESFDDEVLASARARFSPPANEVVKVRLEVHLNTPRLRGGKSEARRMGELLAQLLTRDQSGLIPLSGDLGRHYENVVVTRYSPSFVKKVADALGRPEEDLLRWEVEPSVCVASPPPSHHPKSAHLAELVNRKSNALARWSVQGCRERWLAIVVNQEEGLSDFQLVIPAFRSELLTLLPRHSFDAIAWVPVDGAGGPFRMEPQVFRF